jgi:hypothetical protein
MPKAPALLYRGMDIDLDPEYYTRFLYGTRQPACSWSEDPDMAHSFGRIVLTAKSEQILKHKVFFE